MLCKYCNPNFEVYNKEVAALLEQLQILGLNPTKVLFIFLPWLNDVDITNFIKFEFG